MRENNTVTWIHGDNLGSAALTTNASGAKVSELRFKPFGEVRYAWNQTATDRRFTGHISEDGIGLIDMRARFYDPIIGRFLSPDSIVPDQQQPISWNRYTYVGNNPLTHTDPDGHCWPVCTMAVGAAIGALGGAIGSAVIQELQTGTIDAGEVVASTVAGAAIGAAIGFAGPLAASVSTGVVATSLAVAPIAAGAGIAGGQAGAAAGGATNAMINNTSFQDESRKLGLGNPQQMLYDGVAGGISPFLTPVFEGGTHAVAEGVDAAFSYSVRNPALPKVMNSVASREIKYVTKSTLPRIVTQALRSDFGPQLVDNVVQTAGTKVVVDRVKQPKLE